MRKRCVTELTRKAEKFEIPFQKIWWLPGFNRQDNAYIFLSQCFNLNQDYIVSLFKEENYNGKMLVSGDSGRPEQNI